MAPEYADKVRFAKADVTTSPETAAQFMVMGLPTLVVLKDGKQVQKVSGGQSRPRVEKLISKVT
jgi:thioredoxin 1